MKWTNTWKEGRVGTQYKNSSGEVCHTGYDWKWEEVYQEFEARRRADEKKFRPHCIVPYSPKYDTAIRLLHNCLLDRGPNKRFWAEVESFLEAELDKLPEPECEHGRKEAMYHKKQFTGYTWVSYKNEGDKHCRDCGEKL
ncbi:hypothetical protein LCGC14_1639170 [marine sediment metagenome]|uniref:Uncharacterized protein n=1 Tax=marine sediment metagenome TaxID=412755 RepID=A0A0F9KZQ4_9ZZZZ